MHESQGLAAHADVAAFAMGAMDREDDAVAQDHLDQCESCRDELVAFVEILALLDTADKEEVLAALEEEPKPVEPQADQVNPKTSGLAVFRYFQDRT